MYTLTVQARDDGSPSTRSVSYHNRYYSTSIHSMFAYHHQATAEVVVTVEDVNDNQPQFTELEYDFTQPEDNQLSVVIAQIEADDGDNGSNADVMYFISRGNDDGIFSILPNTVSFCVQEIHSMKVAIQTLEI